VLMTDLEMVRGSKRPVLRPSGLSTVCGQLWAQILSINVGPSLHFRDSQIDEIFRMYIMMHKQVIVYLKIPEMIN
jgi:hypothetical protein